MKIGIILGSTRDGRFGSAIAEWINSVAQERDTDATYELIDVKDYDLPFFSLSTPPMGLNKQYGDAKVQAWSEKIDSLDGYIFVSAEYNHSIPAPFKNAFDSLGTEWSEKPVVIAAYGFAGGVDAAAAWRPVIGTFKMKEILPSLSFNLATEMVEGKFVPAEDSRAALEKAFADLEDSLN